MGNWHVTHCILCDADSPGSDTEGRQSGQAKAGGRRQQFRKALQLLSPSYEVKNKGGHLV